MPEEKFNIVSFNIKDTNSSFANAIRRVLVSEIPVWSLVIDEKLFETNDPYIRFDDFGERINCLPIHQSYLNKISEKQNLKDKDMNEIFKLL